ncbi:MAG: Hsp20/alpha crystallin family protein [Flammeovirgaceae bacterium]
MCRRAYHPHWKKQYAKKWLKHKFASAWNQAPVNVKEYDDQYLLLLYAAGYAKSDFQVSLKDHTLVITVKKASHEQEDGWHWRRQEFHAGAFEREFELNEKVNKAEITAKYEEGILTVTLPKLEGFETQRQDIDID